MKHTPSSVEGAQTPMVLEAKGLCKSYGSLKANDDVDFSIKRGTIHGLIGENGAGKSTLLKLLFGYEKPDHGQVKFNGKTVRWTSPRQAYEAGIGMVNQHFQLIADLSGLDNVILGEEPSLWSFLPRFLHPIDRRKAAADLEAVLREKEWQNLPLNKSIKDLPLGSWQRLEILKMLYRQCAVIFMDEPTALLAPHEITALLADLRSLKAAGKTIVLVSHKLPEIIAVCDEVTVLRHGRVVGRVEVKEALLSKDSLKKTLKKTLATMMMGSPLQEAQQADSRGPDLEVKGPSLSLPLATTRAENPILSLRDVSLFDTRQKLQTLKKVSFEVFPGEILGVAGIEGNGQSPLVRLIGNPLGHSSRRVNRLLFGAGERSPSVWTGGEMLFGNKSMKSFHAKTLRKVGMGMIPEDRSQEGLILEMTAWENFILGYEDHPQWQSFGVIQRKKIFQAWFQACEQFDIRPTDPMLKAGDFSGGNQQKIILARELKFAPSMIVCCHPTRGVDFAAADLLYKHIRAAKLRGAGVMLVSSSLDEIFTLADRIIVLYEGSLVGTLITNQTTPEQVGYLMTGLGLHGSK